MHRPWQIWSIFAACLLAVMVAVGWLSFKAIEADRRDAAAQRQAALEENARLALWRMDSYVAPLVAQESARPYFVYRAFLPAEQASAKLPGTKASSSESLVPSPLLASQNPFVSLYVELDAFDKIAACSPQYPAANLHTLACTWVSREQLRDNGLALAQVEAKIDRAKLLSELPPLEPAVPQGEFYTQTPRLQSALPNQPAANQRSQQGHDSSRQIAALPPPATNLPEASQSGQQPLQQPSQQLAPNAAPEGFGSFEGQARQPYVPQQTQLAKSQAEYQSRAQLVQRGNTANYNYDLNNDFANRIANAAVEVRMSMMKPFWVDGDLLLARRVSIGNREMIQAALLNWPEIKRRMLDDIKNLLPEADLQPAANGDEATEMRRLASLPVQLVPGSLPNVAVAGMTPVQMSLLMAWIAMALAAAAAAVLLRGVIALSERRAAFVSAVTHELRTPLTTFRMYAEMLSEGMVREEGERRNYLDTLRREAERLTHLVANVLAYARLERGRPGGRVEVVGVERLLEVATQRLADRAAQCDLKLNVEADPEVLGRRVKTDPSAVEQILFNLVDNACKYAASSADRSLQLVITAKDSAGENGAVYLRLSDHGPGISATEQRRIFQPFRKSAKDAAHSAPGVGLGLSLSRRLARDMGGDLRYEPHADGACFVLSLPIAS